MDHDGVPKVVELLGGDPLTERGVVLEHLVEHLDLPDVEMVLALHGAHLLVVEVFLVVRVLHAQQRKPQIRFLKDGDYQVERDHVIANQLLFNSRQPALGPSHVDIYHDLLEIHYEGAPLVQDVQDSLVALNVLKDGLFLFEHTGVHDAIVTV